ncbi:MAG: lysophospholipid acyltransferase family protein [Sphingomicrobium sp.]
MLAHFRAALRVAALLGWLLTCLPLHLLSKLGGGRSPWPRRFLKGAAYALGVRVRVHGEPAGPHTLLLPNHVSWLDILIVGGTTGCTFVSKDDLGHGLFHWLADQNGTIYVRRAHVKGARDQAIALARALERDQPVAVFPEGTVGTGTYLLPFRSTLLEAANYAAKDVVLRPVVLDYGTAAADIAWFQEPVIDNIKRVLRRRGPLIVDLRLLEPLDRSGDRKQLTAAARAAISTVLGFTGAEPSPIGPRQ